jgi:hypothetical protein
VLMKWNPCFGLRLEPITKHYIWEKLYGPLLEYWSNKILRGIGVNFGKILDVDNSYKSSIHRTIAKISWSWT